MIIDLIINWILAILCIYLVGILYVVWNYKYAKDNMTFQEYKKIVLKEFGLKEWVFFLVMSFILATLMLSIESLLIEIYESYK
jgi:Na+/proline symporter